MYDLPNCPDQSPPILPLPRNPTPHSWLTSYFSNTSETLISDLTSSRQLHGLLPIAFFNPVSLSGLSCSFYLKLQPDPVPSQSLSTPSSTVILSRTFISYSYIFSIYLLYLLFTSHPLKCGRITSWVLFVCSCPVHRCILGTLKSGSLQTNNIE